jgi:hypothetical protein
MLRPYLKSAKLVLEPITMADGCLILRIWWMLQTLVIAVAETHSRIHTKIMQIGHM